mmetsp:Transcript_35544/g.82534  ORF Transcript_35544/g.82534 Transcript_35544/m.82534 type:complete len:104 (+) Transcript_35544:1734-2045(+)
MELKVGSIEITDGGSGYAAERPLLLGVDPPPITARVVSMRSFNEIARPSESLDAEHRVLANIKIMCYLKEKRVHYPKIVLNKSWFFVSIVVLRSCRILWKVIE